MPPIHTMGYHPPFYHYAYQTGEAEMSFERGRHQRQYADRVRQRQCRARKKRRITDLEDEIQTLRARLTQVEEERNNLQAIVDENGEGSIPRSSGIWAMQPPDEGVSSSNTRQPYPTFSKSCSGGPEILVRQGEDSEERIKDPLGQQSNRLEESLGLTLPMQPASEILPPAWTRLPRSTPPSCPLDTVLAELEVIGRRAEARNLRIPEFIEPAVPAISLHERQPNHYVIAPSHPGHATVSSILVDHISLGMKAKSNLVRLTALSILFYYVRWRICQSPDTFGALPDFLHPTSVQLCVPHPQWIDLIPWPALRDFLILNLDGSQYAQFRDVLNDTFVMKWPQPISGCVVKGKDCYTLSLEFRRHLCNIDNWAMKPQALKEFPFLREVVNVLPEHYHLDE